MTKALIRSQGHRLPFAYPADPSGNGGTVPSG